MFSKNIKSILIILMLITISLSSVVLSADCDMMGMISKSNSLISNIEDPDNDTLNDFDDPVDYFDYIRERSTHSSPYIGYVSGTKNNDDGYGFIYYKENNYSIPCYYPDPWNPLNQAWYLHGEYHVNYYGDNFNPNQTSYESNIPLNVTESMVLNYINYSTYYIPPSYPLQDDDTNNATILLGHARQGTWGTGNHPFRFEHNNRTYIFMHNGGLDDDFIDALEAYLPSLENDQWFANHLPNWGQGSTPPINSLVDTELLFHYIMSFIIDNDNDIISGIHDAITQTDIEGCNIRGKIENPDPSILIEDNNADSYINVTNFVLSDGEKLYVFRNSPSDDNWHELSYKDNDTFYSVKTLNPRGGNIMNKHDFVILSRDEEPIVYSNFLEMKIFSEDYNWESFPCLNRNNTINEAVDIVPILQTIEPFGDIENIFFEAVEDVLTYDYDGFPYQWNYPSYNIQSTRLYKIKADPYVQRTLELSGTRMEANYELEYSLSPYTYHWLGYWLPQTQKMIESFGDYWQYVEKVKSEDWYYNKRSIIRGGDPYGGEVVISAEGLTLEYGKGYMVWFKDLPQPISDFHWTLDNTAEEPEKKAEPESFTYTEKADYEAIDVFNIPPNVTEIGVFEDDVCVGAVVVEDTCAQILVYSDNSNRDPIPFTFEIVTGRGLSTPVKDYQVLDLQTGKYENKSIFSGRQEYSIMRFADENEPENIVSKPVLKGNYPNPFNPTTTISFSLPNEQEIELTIYNIKGQKVKQLINGQLTAGQHSMIWDGKDTNDKSVGSGIYFYKLKTGNDVLTRKMLMMK